MTRNMTMDEERKWAAFAGKLLEDSGDDVLAWVAGEFYPEDVFSEEDLERWADENGYVQEQA